VRAAKGGANDDAGGDDHVIIASVSHSCLMTNRFSRELSLKPHTTRAVGKT
jgi:hypothetical protein